MQRSLDVPGRPRLLVVDDEPDALEMLLEWLTLEGYDARGAPDPGEALEVLRAGGVDVLVTDYMLPEQDGLELVATARDEGLIDVRRVLLLSGSPPWREAAELGVRAVKKPIDLVALVSEVERLLDRRVERAPRGAPQAAVQLVLYVSEGSAASLRAIRKLNQRLARVPEATVSLVVRDVATWGDEALADRISFTPTLVRVAPRPRIRLIGDLRDDRSLEDVLVAPDDVAQRAREPSAAPPAALTADPGERTDA